MNVHEPQYILRDALRRLAEEARLRAGALPLGTAEHDFYVGVITAAQDLAGPAPSRAADRSALEGRSPAFRDGYLKVSNMAGAAIGHSPPRFPLPTPDRRPPEA